MSPIARLYIVPEGHWEILRKYLDTRAVVLLPECVLKEFSSEKQAALRVLSEQMNLDYGFGGEADVDLDIILSPGAYAIGELLGDELGAGEGE